MTTSRLAQVLLALLALLAGAPVRADQQRVVVTGAGESPASAFAMLNANDAELYTRVGGLAAVLAGKVAAASPTFTGVVTAPALVLSGAGSSGDASGLTVTPNAGAPAGSFASLAYHTLRGTTFLLAPYITNTACGADQRDNIRNALPLAPAGGRVVLPPGCIAISGTITNNGQTWEGAGIGYAGGTELRYTATSGTALNLLGSGARLANVALTNPVASSSATAVQMGDAVSQPNSQSVEGIHVEGYQTQIDVQSGQYWHVTRFDLHNAGQCAFRLRNIPNHDAGDGNITGGTAYADSPVGDTGAAYCIASGGGLKIKGTKVLQFGHAVDLLVVDGPGTSDLLVDASNSFENQVSGYASRYGRAGTNGIWHNIRDEAQSVGGVEVYDGVDRVQIGGNRSYAPNGVKIAGGDNVTVLDGTAVHAAGTACVDIQDPATNVQVGQVNCTASPAIVLDERTTGAGQVRREHTRPIALAANAGSGPGNAYVPLYRIELPVSRGARVWVQVEGSLASKGAVNTLLDYTLTRNAVAVTAAPVNAGNPVVTAGYGVDVQFDTTTVVGAVIVGVRNNAAAGGGALTGSVSIRVEGKSTYFKVL